MKFKLLQMGVSGSSKSSSLMELAKHPKVDKVIVLDFDKLFTTVMRAYLEPQYHRKVQIIDFYDTPAIDKMISPALQLKEARKNVEEFMKKPDTDPNGKAIIYTENTILAFDTLSQYSEQYALGGYIAHRESTPTEVGLHPSQMQDRFKSMTIQDWGGIGRHTKSMENLIWSWRKCHIVANFHTNIIEPKINIKSKDETAPAQTKKTDIGVICPSYGSEPTGKKIPRVFDACVIYSHNLSRESVVNHRPTENVSGGFKAYLKSPFPKLNATLPAYAGSIRGKEAEKPAIVQFFDSAVFNVPTGTSLPPATAGIAKPATHN